MILIQPYLSFQFCSFLNFFFIFRSKNGKIPKNYINGSRDKAGKIALLIYLSRFLSSFLCHPTTRGFLIFSISPFPYAAPSKASVIFHRTPEPSTFPGPASKPLITDVTENSVKLMWQPNVNQGASPVFAYTVEYFSHETGEVR